jgi:hypothetical protein
VFCSTTIFFIFIVGRVDVPVIASKSRKENENIFNTKMARAGLILGGRFRPSTCNPHNTLAIIVPYRQREFHLKVFLRYIHPFLMRQQLEYSVFVVEQSGKCIPLCFDMISESDYFNPNRPIAFQSWYAYEYWLHRGSKAKAVPMFYFSRC